MKSYEITKEKAHNLEVPGSSPGWSTSKRLNSNELEPFFVPQHPDYERCSNQLSPLFMAFVSLFQWWARETANITPTECRGAVPITVNRLVRDRTYTAQPALFHNSRRGVRHQPSPPPHRLRAERWFCRPGQ